MSDWVKCPICGEPDMRQEPEGEGFLIHCTNIACPSNGGPVPSPAAPAAQPDMLTCVVCGATLLPPNVPPHCEDCLLTEEHYEDWNHPVAAPVEAEAKEGRDSICSGDQDCQHDCEKSEVVASLRQQVATQAKHYLRLNAESNALDEQNERLESQLAALTEERDALRKRLEEK